MDWLCKDCGEIFFSERKLRKHRGEVHPDKISTSIPCKCEYCGMKFPSRNQLNFHTCKNKPERKKPQRRLWKCKTCGNIFETRKKLYDHRKTVHPTFFTNKKRNRSGICPRCNQPYTGRLLKHFKICPNVNHSRHPTEEVRKKISISRSKFLKEHPEQYPWRRKDKFKSIPCEYLKEILKKDGYQFTEEFHDSRWSRHFSLDIAFLDKKIAVEVNGTQHYDKDGNLSKYYQERHNYIENQGWIVLEIFYTNVYKQAEIDKIKKAIDERKQISDEEQKTLIQILKKKKEENKKKEKIKKLLTKPDSLGRIRNRFKVPSEVWVERKEKILNCGVDSTKYGWIIDVTRKTGLTKRMIETTIKYFPKEFSNCKFTSRKKF